MDRRRPRKPSLPAGSPISQIPVPTRKPKKDRRPVELDTEVDKDQQITSLKNKLQRMEQLARDQRQLIDCMEKKDRRVRIWTVSIKCTECNTFHYEFVAFINRMVFHSAEYNRLVQRLRGLGYFIKSKGIEQIPTETSPLDGEYAYMINYDTDLRDLKIPDCIPDDIMEGLKQEETGGEALI